MENRGFLRDNIDKILPERNTKSWLETQISICCPIFSNIFTRRTRVHLQAVGWVITVCYNGRKNEFP